MAEYNGGTIGRILRELSGCGLNPVAERVGPCGLIRVRRGGEDVHFIVVGDYAATPEEAVRRSEAIAAVLASLRQGSKAMVVTKDLWERRHDMTLGRMLSHCGIFTRVFARNCEVRRIPKPVADAFMDSWHSYGTASCRHRYGLFTVRETLSQPSAPRPGTSSRTLPTSNPASASQAASGSASADAPPSAAPRPRVIPAGTLVAVAEFSNARRMPVDGRTMRSYEWIRYASIADVRVDGGMGKILGGFIRDVGPEVVMTYADLEWSDGGAYRTLGFKEVGTRPAVLFAIDPVTMRRIPISGSRKAAAAPGVDPVCGQIPVGRCTPADEGDARKAEDAKIPEDPATGAKMQESPAPSAKQPENPTAGSPADGRPEDRHTLYYSNFGSSRFLLIPRYPVRSAY